MHLYTTNNFKTVILFPYRRPPPPPPPLERLEPPPLLPPLLKPPLLLPLLIERLLPLLMLLLPVERVDVAGDELEIVERLLLPVLLPMVVEGADERELLLILLLRETDVDVLLLFRVIVVDELVPEETEPLRVVRVVEELPLNVLSLRSIVLLFVVPTDERVERFVLVFTFDTALPVELREVASLLNEVLRPVVADVLRFEEVVLRDEATAELRLFTADEEV